MTKVTVSQAAAYDWLALEPYYEITAVEIVEDKIVFTVEHIQLTAGYNGKDPEWEDEKGYGY